MNQSYKPLKGRIIVTRETQLRSDVLVIPDSYFDLRTMRSADRGRVLASGETPDGGETINAGDEVFYHGPADKLAIEWDGQRAFAVHHDEVLAVIT